MAFLRFAECSCPEVKFRICHFSKRESCVFEVHVSVALILTTRLRCIYETGKQHVRFHSHIPRATSVRPDAAGRAGKKGNVPRLWVARVAEVCLH